MPDATSRDGTRISFDSKGEGPAIILVAGATQYRAVDAVTPLLANELARQFTVINYDRRGRGQSGDTHPWTPASEIEDIAALVEWAGGETMLFGMSSGAILALEAAAAMPRVIRRLALYEPPVDPARPNSQVQAEADGMVAMARRGAAGEMMEHFMLSVGMPKEQLEGFKQSPAWADYEAVGLTIANDLRIVAGATEHDDVPERWQEAGMPVLVINGAASYDFMAAGADYVAQALPNATRLTLKDQSHQYDPKVLAPALASFFKG